MENEKISLKNREEAALQLIELLPTNQMIQEDWLLVAISKGGALLTERIARKLHLDFDMLLIEPIYSPVNPECVIAMVSETEEIVIHNELTSSFDINLDFIYSEAHRRYEEKILKNIYKYRKGELISSLRDRHVMLVDEGCETGMSVLTSIKTAINAGAKSVYFASPLMPTNVIDELDAVVDEVYMIYKISNFVSVDFYYEEYDDISSELVKSTIENSQYYLPYKKNLGDNNAILDRG